LCSYLYSIILTVCTFYWYNKRSFKIQNNWKRNEFSEKSTCTLFIPA